MRAFPFLLREALVNLKRHGLMTVASVTTIAVSLALLGGFVLTFYQVSTAARRAVDDFEMRVFCRQGVPKSALPALGKRIRKLDGVGTVRYLSKEDAFREQTRDLPIDLSGIPNQMNETFVVKLADPGRAPAIARTIRTRSRRRSSVSSGRLRRTRLPSFDGLSPRSDERIAFSIAVIDDLSYGEIVSIRGSGALIVAICRSGVCAP